MQCTWFQRNETLSTRMPGKYYFFCCVFKINHFQFSKKQKIPYLMLKNTHFTLSNIDKKIKINTPK